MRAFLTKIKNAVGDRVYSWKQARADKAAGITVARSPHWPAARRRWLETHPTCAASGISKKVQVHHKNPFHLHPELELADGSGQFGTPVGLCNFITLSEAAPANYHLHIGHGGDWHNFNANVETDAAKCLAMLKGAHRK